MTTPSWYFDELGHAGPEHLDAGCVAGYDRKTGVDPAGDLALLLELGLDEDDTLLDLGTGTGALPLIAAAHCRKVIAFRRIAAMLKPGASFISATSSSLSRWMRWSSGG